MMKKVRRIHSLLLAMGMFVIMICFDTPLSVKAAEGGYTYYVMMKTDPTAEYYVENEGLAASLGDLTAGGSPIFTVEKAADENRWNVTTTDADCTQEEVAGALATIKDQAIARGTFTGNTLDLGYGALVLIRSRAGVYFTVEIENASQKIYEQSGPIQPVKNDTLRAETITCTGSNCAEIGETVAYSITVIVPKCYKDIKLYHTVPKGLTLNTNEISITQNETPVTGLSWTESVVDNNKKQYCVSLQSEENISDQSYTISYTAEINKNAQAGIAEIVEVYLQGEYADNTQTSMASNYAFYTFGFDLKVTDSTGATLSDATFSLKNDSEKYYTASTDATQEATARFQVVTGGDPIPTVTTDDTGVIHFNGLKPGNYVLTEIATTSGYETLKDAINLTIGVDGQLTVTNDSNLRITNNSKDQTEYISGSKSTQYGTLTMTNKKEILMPIPNTGGTGTTVFYVLGGLFMLSAGTLLVLRRRRSA